MITPLLPWFVHTQERISLVTRENLQTNGSSTVFKDDCLAVRYIRRISHIILFLLFVHRLIKQDELDKLEFLPFCLKTLIYPIQ